VLLQNVLAAATSDGAGLLQEVSAAATSHTIACDNGIFSSNNFGLADLHHRFKISATIIMLICINGRIFFCYVCSVNLHQGKNFLLTIFCRFASMHYFCYY
jgi:hypothetical protein